MTPRQFARALARAEREGPAAADAVRDAYDEARAERSERSRRGWTEERRREHAEKVRRGRDERPRVEPRESREAEVLVDGTAWRHDLLRWAR